jgi:hypothetical protein
MIEVTENPTLQAVATCRFPALWAWNSKNSEHYPDGRLECLNLMILEGDVRHGVLCFMPDPRDAFVIPFFHQIDQLGIYHSICRVCFQSASENTKLITGEEQHQCKKSPRNWAS